MNKVFSALRKIRDEQDREPANESKAMALPSDKPLLGNGSAVALPALAPKQQDWDGTPEPRALLSVPPTLDNGSTQTRPSPMPKKWGWGRTKTPKVQESIDEHLVAFHNPMLADAEQYRKLYAEIIRAGRVRPLRTMLFSSTLPGEGKTTSALNLAITIGASAGESGVLLIDTDFRKPSVHKYLGTHPHCGLADYLQGDVEYAEIFMPTQIPALTVVYAGKRLNNPFDLLTSEKMAQFFEQLKSHTSYSYIILDSSPVLLTSEPRALVQHVDATLLVVRAQKTSKNLIAQAIEALGEENILGFVFNGVSRSALNYYGDYYGEE